MPDDSKPDLDHLTWATEQRSEIQRTLLALYTYVRRTKPQQLYVSIVLDNSIASAFSLWRAVFLAEKTRTVFTAHEAQERFLEAVVTNNAINFSDDRRNSAWTVGYYLENAKHRTAYAARIAAEKLDFGQFAEVMGHLRFVGENDPAHTRYEWEAVHFAVRTVFNVIAPSDLRLPLKPPSAKKEPLVYVGGPPSAGTASFNG